MNKFASLEPNPPSAAKLRASVGNVSALSGRRNAIFGTLTAALLLGGLIVAAKPDPERIHTQRVESRAPLVLSAAETKFDFGSISMAAGKVAHRFWITNSGAEPVVIRKIYTSCMCTTASLIRGERQSDRYGMPGHGHIPAINEPVAAQERVAIEVVFDPAAHGPAGIGPNERHVMIENSTGQALELTFTALVKP
jgi:hypothetical protein